MNVAKVFALRSDFLLFLGCGTCEKYRAEIARHNESEKQIVFDTAFG